MRVLQVPETCSWNEYVACQARHLAARGIEVMLPALCRDEPGFLAVEASRRTDTAPDIVHVHWPEIPGRQLGDASAIDVLRAMTATADRRLSGRPGDARGPQRPRGDGRAGGLPPRVSSAARVARLLRGVDWVALPYQRVWSSGVLVAAAQHGRPILCPPPLGADAYGAVLGDWRIVEPWDDDRAVLSWQEALAEPARRERAASGAPDGLTLPD